VSQRELFQEFGTEFPSPHIPRADDLEAEGTPSSWALFSKDRVYRYLLGREWSSLPFLCIGMANPSSAGGFEDDPTIRKATHFARRDGFGGLIVWNAEARIATYPSELAPIPEAQRFGPHNRDAIISALTHPRTGLVALAWGVPPTKAHRDPFERALRIAKAHRKTLSCFGVTKENHPRHPLYLANDTKAMMYWTAQ